ncbi:hypothetical protein C2U55_26650 [Enterobacteriaceae bacterium ENNIH3]|nr:hypothetical protein C2U55_26650 [Enterobacteriaceae bacterium ENNIH3]AUV07568.1 hypothetical protein C2U52_15460 [Enterobacteriaceae bacterium ENNIH2]
MINHEQIQALKAAAVKAIGDDWGYDRDELAEIVTPETILSLLAERDADKALIAKSVVLFETLRQRIAELEAKTLTVKLPDSIPCPTAPEIIWLQTNGDDSDESKWPESDDDVSWCREKIFTNDTLYVRADLAAAGITLVVGSERWSSQLRKR